MANPTDILVDLHWEGSDLVCMSRVRGADATNITQATISSIEGKVFNRTTRVQIGSTFVPVVVSTVFDTLQTDARWTKDSTGYNFRYTVAGTYFPDGDVTYRVEIWATPSSGEAFPLFAGEVESQNRFGG